MNWKEALFAPSGIILQKIGGFILILLTVFLFLLFGWLLALLVRKIALNFLKKINLDRYLAGSWLERFLTRGGIAKSPAELLANFSYWITIVIFIVLASQSLGLEATGDLLDRFLIFLPQTIAFGLILIFGIIFGNFLGRLFQIISGNLGIKEFKTMGRIIQAVVIIYAGIIALEQLGINILAVVAFLNYFWAGVCLTLALALGLGGKELVKNYLGNLVKKFSGRKNLPEKSKEKEPSKKIKESKEKQEFLPYD